jgi:hypothetical protein
MFIAMHANATHTISLPLSADEAFPLFTPEGERLWIAEWNPHYFYPANGETIVGMAFTTGEGDETTYWTLADFDSQAHRVRYIRVTPGSRSVIVTVRCDAVSDAECTVTVDYTLTGLSEPGNTAIAGFIDGYVTMIENWRVKILDYLDLTKVTISP